MIEGGLEAHSLGKVPEGTFEMYGKRRHPRSYLKLFTNRYMSRFLLVSLNIDSILQETTIHGRLQKLNALAVEIGSPNLSSDNIPPVGILLSCYQGPAVIDKEAAPVGVIHLTLQEYSISRLILSFWLRLTRQ